MTDSSLRRRRVSGRPTAAPATERTPATVRGLASTASRRRPRSAVSRPASATSPKAAPARRGRARLMGSSLRRRAASGPRTAAPATERIFATARALASTASRHRPRSVVSRPVSATCQKAAPVRRARVPPTGSSLRRRRASGPRTAAPATGLTPAMAPVAASTATSRRPPSVVLRRDSAISPRAARVNRAPARRTAFSLGRRAASVPRTADLATGSTSATARVIASMASSPRRRPVVRPPDSATWPKAAMDRRAPVRPMGSRRGRRLARGPRTAACATEPTPATAPVIAPTATGR